MAFMCRAATRSATTRNACASVPRRARRIFALGHSLPSRADRDLILPISHDDDGEVFHEPIYDVPGPDGARW